MVVHLGPLRCATLPDRLTVGEVDNPRGEQPLLECPTTGRENPLLDELFPAWPGRKDVDDRVRVAILLFLRVEVGWSLVREVEDVTDLGLQVVSLNEQAAVAIW